METNPGTAAGTSSPVGWQNQAPVCQGRIEQMGSHSDSAKQPYDVSATHAVAESVDRSMPFIDTHYHLWQPSKRPYDWLTQPRTDGPLGDYRAICGDWGPERLFREFYGQNVVKSIHVEADYSGDPIEETTWLESIRQSYGMPNALVVMAEAGAADFETQIEQHMAASPAVRGIRVRADPDDVTASSVRASFKVMAHHELSYELTASPGRLKETLPLVAEYPDVQFVLGHVGFPLERNRAYFELWRAELAALAAAPNVASKISGLASVDHTWSIASLSPWVLECIEIFGYPRVMFGTNWPVDGLFATYLEQVDAWRKIVAGSGATAEEQRQLLSGNAELYYRI